MKKPFLEEVLAAILKAKEKFGSARTLSDVTGVSPANISRWLNGRRMPRVEEIAPILDALGASIHYPEDEEQAREVCFVNAKVVRSGAEGPPIIAEEYMAVPLVAEVGAGSGVVPREEFAKWVLIERNTNSLAQRSNFIAVEVGHHSRSMIPLLYPGDIVLVDLDDKGKRSAFSAPGNIYLVREPGQEGGGKIKRVSVSGQGQNTVIIYYSENIAENEPEAYFLYQDFDGHWGNAIVGKVMRAWTDISRK